MYHGGLGKDCFNLISYLESRGAPPIELGDNPANWMLRVMDSGVMGDLAESYLQSADYASLCTDLQALASGKDAGSKIVYIDEFAVSPSTRRSQINWRLRTIYWRSPSYNLSRLVVSLVIAFVLGSVFVTKRNPAAFTESDMRARVSVVFLTFIITGIQAVLSVLPVMTMIRDLFYLHRDAGMYDSGSMGLALGVAEKGFIVVSTAIFTLVFLATSGIAEVEGQSLVTKAGRCIGFWVCWAIFGCELRSTRTQFTVFSFPGLFYLQLCHLLVLWSTVCVPGEAYGNCYYSIQCVHRTEQLFQWFGCSPAIHGWNLLRRSVLDYTRSFRLRWSHIMSLPKQSRYRNGRLWKRV